MRVAVMDRARRNRRRERDSGHWLRPRRPFHTCYVAAPSRPASGWASLVAAFRRGVENSKNSHEFPGTTTICRVCVEEFAGVDFHGARNNPRKNVKMRNEGKSDLGRGRQALRRPKCERRLSQFSARR
jgi:hypothetical protein